MRTFVKLFCILAAVSIVLYISGWVLLIGGIVNIVDAVKATPTNTGQLIWGLVEAFVLPELVAFVVAIFTGFVLSAITFSGYRNRSGRLGGSAKQVQNDWNARVLRNATSAERDLFSDLEQRIKDDPFFGGHQ